MDFFEDMTPKIIKQKKLLIRSDSGGGANSDPSFTRLEATSDIPVIVRIGLLLLMRTPQLIIFSIF